MRSIHTLASIATLGLFVACNSSDTTRPLIDDGAPVSLDGSPLGLAAAAGGATGATAMLPPLPPELKLSDAQRAQISQLISDFQDATKADMTALVAIQRQAEAARKAGKSEAEVKAILAQGAMIKGRLEAAQVKLRTAIEAVLTPAQRDWIRSHAPRVCSAAGIVLTQAQQAQIKTLLQSFEQANRADLITVANAMEQARAAKRAGKTDAEIRAILQTASAAQGRLEAAHKTLQTQIEAVLTPEQKASGCFTKRP